MGVDPKLLEILVCPADRADLELIELPEAVCTRLVEKYREQFKDEEPEVSVGLKCTQCGQVYPVVSDIPVMLVDEALSAEEVSG